MEPQDVMSALLGFGLALFSVLFFVSNFIPWNGDAFSAQVVLAKSLPCISEKTLDLDF